MKPGSCMSGEHCVPWETFCGGRQSYQGLVGDLTRCVKPTAQAPPARRAQVVPGQSVAPGLLEVERPGGECGRNAWNRATTLDDARRRWRTKLRPLTSTTEAK